MISLVNGYICHNYREVMQAMQGLKPPAKPGELPYSSQNDSPLGKAAMARNKAADAVNAPANDKAVATATASNAGSQTNGDTTQQAVNLLA
ncbi:MAG: hypothetical protein GC182_20215 [Rhodopseudomonas sp.]|nr:hypothetical protein [Rhodopseudomonas sp.]